MSKTQSLSDTPIPNVRHDQFFFKDKPVVFLVENVLFRVPSRHFSTHSPLFRDMFSMPPPAGKPRDGDTVEQPIKLSDDSAEDFAALLGFFHRDLSDFKDSKGEWISVLRVAHKWQMESVQQAAIDALGKHPFEDPFSKLVLCETFDIDLDWASDAIHKICIRDESLTVAEGRQLTQDLGLALSFVRQERQLEELRANTRDYKSSDWGHHCDNCRCGEQDNTQIMQEQTNSVLLAMGRYNPSVVGEEA